MLKQTIRPRRVVPLARVTARGLLSTASAVVAGIMVAVLAAGGSYALWNDSAEISDVTLSSGTVGLTISAVPDLSVSSLTPGSSVFTEFTATNNGDADLLVVMSGTYVSSQINDLARFLTLTLANDYSVCNQNVPGDSGIASGFTSTDPVRINAGASTKYCLVVTLTDSIEAPQGSTAAFTLTFDGTQTT